MKKITLMMLALIASFSMTAQTEVYLDEFEDETFPGWTFYDEDGDGNPVGLEFTVITADAGDATMSATLRHEPKKPNDGTLADAGGETDFTEIFSLTVE